MFSMLLLCLLVLTLAAAYRGWKLLNWTLGIAAILAAFAFLTPVSKTAVVVLALLFAIVLVPLNFKPLCRQRLTAPFLAMYRKMLPTLSDTEQAALEAGTVGWEGELFAGNPDWQILLDTTWPSTE